MNSPMAEDFINDYELICEVLEDFIDNWQVVMNEIPAICSEQQLHDLDDLVDRLYACFQDLLGETEDEEETQDD